MPCASWPLGATLWAVVVSSDLGLQCSERVLILFLVHEKSSKAQHPDFTEVPQAAAQLSLNLSAAEIDRGSNFTEDSFFLSNLLIHKSRGATLGSFISPPCAPCPPSRDHNCCLSPGEYGAHNLVLSDAEHLGPQRGAGMKYQISGLAPNWAA